MHGLQCSAVSIVFFNHGTHATNNGHCGRAGLGLNSPWLLCALVEKNTECRAPTKGAGDTIDAPLS